MSAACRSPRDSAATATGDVAARAGRRHRATAARYRARHHQRGRVDQGRRLAVATSSERFAGFEQRAAQGGCRCCCRARTARSSPISTATPSRARHALSTSPGEAAKRSAPPALGLHRADQPIAAARRSSARLKRSPRVGRARRDALPDQHLAGQPRALSRQRVLQERGRIRVRDRRGDARPNTKRSPQAGFIARRSTTPGCRRCGTASAWRWGSTRSAGAAWCASRRSTTRCATSPRNASAIICAGAAGTARTPTTSRWSHIVDIMLSGEGASLSVRGRQRRATSTNLPSGRRSKLPRRQDCRCRGVVTHSTDIVEHPDLVAQRLQRFARSACGRGKRHGRNAIAALAAAAHPQIAWAEAQGAGRAAPGSAPLARRSTVLGARSPAAPARSPDRTAR